MIRIDRNSYPEIDAIEALHAETWGAEWKALTRDQQILVLSDYLEALEECNYLTVAAYAARIRPAELITYVRVLEVQN